VEVESRTDSGLSKKDLAQLLVSEAQGFYALLMTVASSFLGGSLLFLEKLGTTRNLIALTALAIGWVSLVLSVCFLTWGRLKNLESGKLALKGSFKEADSIDTLGEAYMIWAVFTLGIGLFGVSAFGFTCIVERSFMADTKVSVQTSNQGVQLPHEGQKSIPFGSMGPSQVQSQTPSNARPVAVAPADQPAQGAATPAQEGKK